LSNYDAGSRGPRRDLETPLIKPTDVDSSNDPDSPEKVASSRFSLLGFLSSIPPSALKWIASRFSQGASSVWKRIFKPNPSAQFDTHLKNNQRDSAMKVALSDPSAFQKLHKGATKGHCQENTLFLGVAQNFLGSSEAVSEQFSGSSRSRKAISNSCLQELDKDQNMSIKDQR
jgi:hypothetical protein